MKLAISNIGWIVDNDTRVYEQMMKYGYIGLEIAPTRIFSENPYDRCREAEVWSQQLKERYGFTVPSMQSIWFGRSEKLFASAEERKELLDYTKKAIDFAQAIGCGNLVFGCPRNRNVEDGMSTDPALEFFYEIGEYAYKSGTIIGMEANPPIYNTNYINDTLSAIHLIEEVNSKGFRLNLDLGTVIQNEEDINEIKGKVKLINHVHISEPGLKPIQKRELHKKMRDILAEENYQRFVSIEMGTVEDVTIIEDVLKYVEGIFG